MFRVKSCKTLKYSLKYKVRSTNRGVPELFWHGMFGPVFDSLGEVVKELPKQHIP